jgi:putative transposase
VPPRLVYLTLCRSIQLLALLAHGDAAKELEILVLRHQLTVLRRQTPRPRLEPPTERCWPRSAASCPDPVGPASSSRPRRCWAGTDAWSPAPGPTRTISPADHHWTMEVQPLIVRLARANPTWGSQPIKGEP